MSVGTVSLSGRNEVLWPELPETSVDGLNLLKRAVWVFGLTTGKIEWGNPAALHLWQADNTEILRAKSEVVSAAARERVGDVAQRIGRGEIVTEEWTFYPNGTPLAVGVTISACAYQGQNCFLCEAALAGGRSDHDSLAKATLIETFHQSPIPILVCDRAGTIVQLNTVARSEFGVGAGAHLSSISDTGSDSPLVDLLSVTVGAQHEVADIMFGVRRNARWWRVFAQAAFNPTSGQEAVYFYLLNVTVEKESTDALVGQESLLEQALNALPVAVSLKDREGRYVLANRMLGQYLGTGEHKLKGCRLVDLVPDGAAEAILAKDEFVWGTGEPFHAEESHALDGELRQMLSGRELVDGPDNEQLLLSAWVDVTALKAAEFAAERANEAKSGFLAAISHEIRTPMNGVLGLANLLNDTPLSRDQRRMLGTISDSGQHLMQLINDILDFSKIEASMLSLEIESFELSNVLNYISDILAPRAKQSGLDLLITTGRDVPTMLRGDLGRLRQVLVNLLGNAVKFTRQGGVHLGVSLVSRSETTAVLAFRVEDTGIGISEEDKEGLFQPFTQVDATAARRYDGVGLGLAISRRLVDLMQGSMQMKSRLGQGSVFTVSIPFDLTAADEARDGMEFSADPLLNKRVALVGLSAFVAERLSRQVSDWGGQVQVFAKADEAARHGADVFLVTNACISELRQPDRAILVDDWHGVQSVSDEPFVDRLIPPITAAKLKAALDRVLLIERVSQEAQAGTGPGLDLDAEVADLAPQTGAALRELARSEPTRVRILVAEDNTTNQYVITKMLSSLGHTVDVVGNGVEAITAISEIPYDVVLMDVRMPEMDGIDATKHIRSLPSPACDTAIVAITADVLQSTVEACSEAGMDTYLSKPLNRDTLVEALEQLMAAGRVNLQRVGQATKVMGGHLDETMVRELLDVLGPDEYGRLLDKTVSNGASLTQALINAARQGNIDEVMKLAHAQRSALGHLGLCHARDLAASLETECGQWSLQELILQIQTLGDAVRQGGEQLRNEFLSQPEP